MKKVHVWMVSTSLFFLPCSFLLPPYEEWNRDEKK